MEQKKYNLGISLLKFILSFFVVLSHYWSNPGNRFLYDILEICRTIAVPIFMFISFIYFTSFNSRSLYNRIKRLYSILFYWSLISFIVAIFLSSISIKDLLFQLLTGHSPNIAPQFWFQIVTIIMSILLTIIYAITHHNGKTLYISVLTLILFLSLFFEYSQINYYLFQNAIYEFRYPLGRIAEMTPYMCLGAIYSECSIIKKIEKHPRFSFIFSSLFLLLGIMIPPTTINGFGYQGIRLIIISTSVVSIIYSISLCKLNVNIQSCLLNLSKYSVGIYGSHYIVGKILTVIISNNSLLRMVLDVFTLKSCVIVWLSSLMLCIILNKICKFFNKITT